MGGDAPIFDVAGRGEEFLVDALVMGCRATGHAGTDKHPPIRGYEVDGGRRFVLFWHEKSASVTLPAPLHPHQIAPMIVAWLQQTADYGTQPGHDGDSGKGWRVFTGSWGIVSNRFGGPYPSRGVVDAIAAVLDPDESTEGRADMIARKAFAAARAERDTFDYGSFSFLAIEPWWEEYGK